MHLLAFLFLFLLLLTSLLMLLNCPVQVTGKLAALKGLDARLREIRSYLDLVIDEKLPLNHEILYHLQVIYDCTFTLHLCSPAHPHPLAQNKRKKNRNQFWKIKIKIEWQQKMEEIFTWNNDDTKTLNFFFFNWWAWTSRVLVSFQFSP